MQTVHRAAAVLAAFSVTSPRLTLNQITEKLGTSKATAHRYTKALRDANMLRYDESTALYSLGAQILALAPPARAGLAVLEVAEPFMTALAEQINQTVVLSVWDGQRPTVVRCADDTNHLVQISIRNGARLDPVRSAQGRLFCAYLPSSQTPWLAAELQRNPPLAQTIEEIRRYGVCVNTPEVTGVRTIAAPVLAHGTVVAAMAVVGTSVTVPEFVEHPMVQRLAETTSALSAQLSARHTG